MDMSKLFSGGLSEVVDSVSKGIDSLFTSDEEKLQAKNILREIDNKLKVKMLEHEASIAKEMTKRMDIQSSIIKAEATSDHWVVASWRPITALVFTFIIANNYIVVPYMEALFSVSIPRLELDQNMWELLKLMIGGYVMGRSVEKVAQTYKGKSK